MASRDEKILLKLQKENHDLSLLSTEKKLCQKKNIQVQKKLIQLCSLYMYSILIDENGQFEGVLKTCIYYFEPYPCTKLQH